MSTDASLLLLVVIALGGLAISDAVGTLSTIDSVFLFLGAFSSLLIGLIVVWELKSASAKNRRKILNRIKSLPASLRTGSEPGVRLGDEVELGISIFLPDSVRLRHTHIIGATGSGKTESVILNFFGKTWRGAWAQLSWMPRETCLSCDPCTLSSRLTDFAYLTWAQKKVSTMIRLGSETPWRQPNGFLLH